jgi:hypothetical protein
MASREGIPVEVVGRPSIGEGRTPGCTCMGFEEVGAVRDGVSEPGRESAMLRFRNAIVCRRGRMTGLEIWIIIVLIDKKYASGFGSTFLTVLLF